MADTEMMALLKEVTQKATEWISQESTLTVTTNFKEAGVAQPSLVLVTDLKLTGDLSSDVPSKRNAKNELTAASELNALHQANVKMALDYRAQLLNSILTALKG